MNLQQIEIDKIDDIIKLSRVEKFQDVIIYCKNGIYQANRLLLSTVFPVMKNYSINSAIYKHEPLMVSIPDLETMELEILFHGIHQQSSTIVVGPVLQDLLLLKNDIQSKLVVEEKENDEIYEDDDTNDNSLLPSESEIREEIDEIKFKCDEKNPDDSHENFETMEPAIKDSDIKVRNEKEDLIGDKVNESESHEYFALMESDDKGIIDKLDIKFDIVDPVVIQIKNNVEIPIEMSSEVRVDCDKSRNDSSNRNSHEKKIHDIKEKKRERVRKKKMKNDINIDCEICGKHFENKLKYKIHLYNHDPKIDCTICGKKFSKSNLRKHMKVSHNQNLSLRNRKWEKIPEGEENVRDPCHECGKVIFRKFMQRHMNSIHFNKKCQKCYQYIKAENFDDHVEGCKPEAVVCNVCGKSFKNQVRLKNHIHLIHIKNDLDPNLGNYCCDICGRYSKTAAALKQHKINLHSPHEIESCPYCGYSGKKSQVKFHIEQNHNERKFSCNECDKQFISKKKLEQHTMNVHVKAYPYHCRYDCGMKYNDPSNRNCHERKKHGAVFKKKRKT